MRQGTLKLMWQVVDARRQYNEAVEGLIRKLSADATAEETAEVQVMVDGIRQAGDAGLDMLWRVLTESRPTAQLGYACTATERNGSL